MDFQTPSSSLIRIDTVEEMIGLCRSTIYNLMNEKSPYFDPTFPKRVRLSPNGRAVAWCKAEVQAWIDSRLMAR